MPSSVFLFSVRVLFFCVVLFCFVSDSFMLQTPFDMDNSISLFVILQNYTQNSMAQLLYLLYTYVWKGLRRIETDIETDFDYHSFWGMVEGDQ